MQEYGWLHWNDFRDMVGVIERVADSRKMRLAGCACIRRVWDRLEDPRFQAGVEVAEAFANFQATKQQLKATRQTITEVIEEARLRVVRDKSQLPEWISNSDHAEVWLYRLEDGLPVGRVATLVLPLLSTGQFGPDQLVPVATGVEHLRNWSGTQALGTWEDRCNEWQAQCNLLRDIFGNPFRPVALDPGWRSDTAVSLAKGIYESRDFSAMPILADALQDAGCENDDILTHCRDESLTHVRGCWVVDLVLGKS
jgi:hypothetical protein